VYRPDAEEVYNVSVDFEGQQGFSGNEDGPVVVNVDVEPE
jgi:hypothetical protein